MTITLDIRPEVQAELARQAQLAGRELEPYAATLLEDATHLPAPEPSGVDEQGFGEKLIEVCARVRGLLTNEETDRLFSRDHSIDRPLDLS